MTLPTENDYQGAFLFVNSESGNMVSDYWAKLTPGFTSLLGDYAPGKRPPNGIAAYSSMDIDVNGGYAYIFGGGHNDYYGNDVWRFDLERKIWRQMYKPDNSYNPPVSSVLHRVDRIRQPGAFVDTQRPIGRHTYYSLSWRDRSEELFAGGGSTYSGNGDYLWEHNGGPWHNSPKDFWRYSPAANKWVYIGSALIDNKLSRACAVYDRERDVFYNITRRNSDHRWVVQSYDPSTGESSQLTGIHKRSDTEFPVVLDSKRNCLWALSSAGQRSILVKYDIAKQFFDEPLITGNPPPATSGQGMAYATHLDRIYVLHGSGVYWLDLAAMEWVKESHTPPPRSAGVFGRWRYDRLRKVIILMVPGMRDFINVMAYVP